MHIIAYYGIDDTGKQVIRRSFIDREQRSRNQHL